MAEKFRAYRTDPGPPLGQSVYTPMPFFYADPSKLQEVLQLPSLSLLKPARVKSYKIMLWGQYPALVNGPLSSHVDGYGLHCRD